MPSFLDALKWPLNQLAAHIDPMTRAETRQPLRNWLTGPVSRDDRYGEPIHDASSLATVINSLIPHPGQSEEEIIAGTVGTMLPGGGVRAARDLMRGPVPESVVNAIGWHGTPHKFAPTPKNALGEFDLSKMGTGQGAQAYGHGLYVAENPAVAGSPEYRTRAAQQDWRIFQLPDKTWGAKAFRGSGEISPSFASKNDVQQWINDPGHLYKVDIPDEHINKMLDWDKGLSEQAPEVQKAVKAAFAEAKIPDAWKSDPDGQSINAWLSSAMGGKNNAELQQNGSALLRRHGIPGIRYLDQGSRGAGQGTSNYVLFDPSIASILARE